MQPLPWLLGAHSSVMQAGEAAAQRGRYGEVEGIFLEDYVFWPLCQSTWGSPVPLDIQGFPQQHSIPGEWLFPCALRVQHPGVPGGDTMQEAEGVPLSS